MCLMNRYHSMITAISTHHPTVTDSLHRHMNRYHTHTSPETYTQMEKCNLKGLCALRDAGEITDVDKRERGTKGRQQKKMREDECKKNTDYWFIKEREGEIICSTRLCLNSMLLLLCKLRCSCSEKNFAYCKKSMCDVYACMLFFNY